jgi:hypothetical protein
MCYQVPVNKKGISTLELGRQYGLNLENCFDKLINKMSQRFSSVQNGNRRLKRVIQ